MPPPHRVAVRSAASRLLECAETRRDLEGLAICSPGRVVAFGDSLTEDPLSWARILESAFRRLAPAGDLTMVNLAAGGDTTVHLVSRFAQVMSVDPGLVIVLAGTNDARVHGRAAGRVLVPDAETNRNLRLLRTLIRAETRAAVWFITPPPIIEDRVRVAPRLLEERVSWRSDAVERKATVVRALGEHVIESRDAVRAPLGRLLRADGLHLTLGGQERLARLVLASLAGGHRSTGR